MNSFMPSALPVTSLTNGTSPAVSVVFGDPASPRSARHSPSWIADDVAVLVAAVLDDELHVGVDALRALGHETLLEAREDAVERAFRADLVYPFLDVAVLGRRDERGELLGADVVRVQAGVAHRRAPSGMGCVASSGRTAVVWSTWIIASNCCDIRASK